MNSLAADPKRTHAVLVGIEHCDAGEDLDGPACDVMDVRAWLCAHGVPAAQIYTRVSPLAKNQAGLEAAGIAYAPATSAGVRDVLDRLNKLQGDLLVLFWAGHGVVLDKNYYLFLADATTADKRNIECNNLCDSLASTFVGGFRRQIVIVDACQFPQRLRVLGASRAAAGGCAPDTGRAGAVLPLCDSARRGGPQPR